MLKFVSLFGFVAEGSLGVNRSWHANADCKSQVGQFRLLQDPNKCIDLRGGQATDGAGIQIWDCNGHTNQNFMWCADGRIVSAINDGMCLDVPGGDASKPHDLQLWQCSGGAGQYWAYDAANSAIHPAAERDKMCIDVSGGSDTNGAHVNIYYCSPGSGNKWYFGSGPPPTPAPPSIPKCSGGKGVVQYFQLDQDTSKCIDIVGGKAVNGAGVQIWGCNGQQNQKFIWCSDGRIVSAINDQMCLDVPGGDPSKAWNLQMWQCNGGRGQYWQYDGNAMAIFPASVGEKMCIDVNGGSTNPGTLVNLYGCSPGTGEKWQINKAAVGNLISV